MSNLKKKKKEELIIAIFVSSLFLEAGWVMVCWWEESRRPVIRSSVVFLCLFQVCVQWLGKGQAVL